MFDLSAIQIIMVLGIALLFIGPKRLPGMAKSLGHGLRGFRDSVSGVLEPDEDDEDRGPDVTARRDSPPEPARPEA